MWTRRRPIGRDYAAAKDAECGNQRAEALDFGFGIVDFGLKMRRAGNGMYRQWLIMLIRYWFSVKFPKFWFTKIFHPFRISP
jgi:hypothetical protein